MYFNICVKRSEYLEANIQLHIQKKITRSNSLEWKFPGMLSPLVKSFFHFLCLSRKISLTCPNSNVQGGRVSKRWSSVCDLSHDACDVPIPVERQTLWKYYLRLRAVNIYCNLCNICVLHERYATCVQNVCTCKVTQWDRIWWISHDPSEPILILGPLFALLI